MHEASLHDENSFITLTYDDEHVPSDDGLRLDHFQDFMKRLRRRVAPRRFKFFHAGEYGENFGRPHYHACLFGLSFPDLVRVGSRNGSDLFTSRALADVWGKGFVTVGQVTFESAAYVAGYCVKKVNGAAAESHYYKVDDAGEFFPVRPEYATMSRGIGKRWLEKFAPEVWRDDFVLSRGHECGVPRYYSKLMRKADPSKFERLELGRRESAKALRAESTPERLEVKRKVIAARHSLKRKVL